MKSNKSLYLQAFRAQKVMMILTGLWPKKEYGICYTLYGVVISFASIILFVFPSLWVAIFSDSISVGKLSYLGFCNAALLGYLVKWICLYVNRNIFHEILNDLKQPLFTNYNSIGEVFIKRAVVISIRIRKLMHYPCILFVFFMVSFPAINNGGSSRPLPFDLPIDMENFPFSIYAIAYFLQVFAASTCILNTTNLDTLICSLIGLGTAQLQILRVNIKNLVNCTSTTEFSAYRQEDYQKYDEEINNNVKTFVQHHTAITSYVQKLEDLFSYAFLGQFLTSILSICISGFGFLVTSKTDTLFGASVSYFMAVMAEISLYCIIGDELTTESLKISDACYMSEWNMVGPEIRKSLCIIMERSKRPIILTAAKFTTLSRVSLMVIFKSSLSYFAVLRKMYEKKD